MPNSKQGSTPRSEQMDKISNLDITDERIFDKAIIISEPKSYMTDLKMVC